MSDYTHHPIVTVADMLEIPVERWPSLLDDLLVFKLWWDRLHEKGMAEGLAPMMRWTDDGDPTMKGVWINEVWHAFGSKEE